MGNSTSAPKATAQDKAILDLKLQRDRLHQYSRRLTLASSSYQRAALSALQQNNKPAALLALRQKKYQESLIQKTDQQLHQLELLTQDVEFALVQKDVLYGLKQGTEVLKEIRKEMGGLENVEKLVGRNEDERAFQEEVSETLRGRMSRNEEDEVEEELEKLEKEGRRTEILPEVPTEMPEHELPDPVIEEPSRSKKARAEAQEPDLVPA